MRQSPSGSVADTTTFWSQADSKKGGCFQASEFPFEQFLRELGLLRLLDL